MKIFKCTPFILFKYDIKFIVFCFPFLLETEFHIVLFFFFFWISIFVLTITWIAVHAHGPGFIPLQVMETRAMSRMECMDAYGTVDIICTTSEFQTAAPCDVSRSLLVCRIMGINSLFVSFSLSNYLPLFLSASYVLSLALCLFLSLSSFLFLLPSPSSLIFC